MANQTGDETKAICVEYAVENLFHEKCYCWEQKDGIYIVSNLNNTCMYAVKEIK